MCLLYLPTAAYCWTNCCFYHVPRVPSANKTLLCCCSVQTTVVNWENPLLFFRSQFIFWLLMKSHTLTVALSGPFEQFNIDATMRNCHASGATQASSIVLSVKSFMFWSGAWFFSSLEKQHTQHSLFWLELMLQIQYFEWNLEGFSLDKTLSQTAKGWTAAVVLLLLLSPLGPPNPPFDVMLLSWACCIPKLSLVWLYMSNTPHSSHTDAHTVTMSLFWPGIVAKVPEGTSVSLLGKGGQTGVKTCTSLSKPPQEWEDGWIYWPK